ncbi:MAG: hypothetical protein HZY76_15135 [Anaerolineae bacterium]|nr:MAG: hypothetical protein HZY76_15135 [Anaerolineae bacterium]
MQTLAALGEHRLATLNTLAQLKSGLAEMQPENARVLAAIVDATYNAPATFREGGPIFFPPPGGFDDYGSALAPWLPKDQTREPFDVPSLEFLRTPVEPALARAARTGHAAYAGCGPSARPHAATRCPGPAGQDPDALPLVALACGSSGGRVRPARVARGRGAVRGRGDLHPAICRQLSPGLSRRLLSPTEDDGWRVFVDAETGDILGEPEHLLMHAPQFFATSRAARQYAIAVHAGWLTSLVQDLAATFIWQFHSDQGGGAFRSQRLPTSRRPWRCTTPTRSTSRTMRGRPTGTCATWASSRSPMHRRSRSRSDAAARPLRSVSCRRARLRGAHHFPDPQSTSAANGFDR